MGPIFRLPNIFLKFEFCFVIKGTEFSPFVCPKDSDIDLLLQQ